MLVLFETPGGYALFKVLDEGKIEDASSVFEQFETPEKANSMLALLIYVLMYRLKLVNFQKFKDTTEVASVVLVFL